MKFSTFLLIINHLYLSTKFMNKIKLLYFIPVLLIFNWCTLNNITSNLQTHKIEWNTKDNEIIEQKNGNESTNSNGNSNINNEIKEINAITTITKNIESVEYENKNYKFKLNIPFDWSFKENNKWFDLILFTPEDDEINENLWIKIQELQTDQSLDSYIWKTESELKNLYRDFSEKEIKNIEVNNWKSIIYEFSDGWINIKAQQTVFIINDIAYVFTYTATKDTYEKYIEAINKTISSFSLLN